MRFEGKIKIKVFVDECLIDEYSFRKDEITVGRHHENDIVLKGDKISRAHCRLRFRDNKYFIHDTSKNGVYINGVRAKENSEYSPGDIVTIHPYRLLISMDESELTLRPSPRAEDSETVFVEEDSDEFREFLKKSFAISRREYEVVEYLLQGKSNKEIAELLDISDLTVKTHLKNIFSKVGVAKRTQLISKMLDIKEK
jgi:DNA-binding CsgD family transcriptional regulator